jgi:hypothetical protein
MKTVTFLVMQFECGSDANILFGTSGWNGTIVPEDFFSKYADQDIRKKKQFQVREIVRGVNYTVKWLHWTTEPKPRGVRNTLSCYLLPKWMVVEHQNDFLSIVKDILPMKAECNVRLGNAGAAKPLIKSDNVLVSRILVANPTH